MEVVVTVVVEEDNTEEQVVKVEKVEAEGRYARILVTEVELVEGD